MSTAIVFLPAVGALIAGLLGRVHRRRGRARSSPRCVPGRRSRPLLDRLLAGGHRRARRCAYPCCAGSTSASSTCHWALRIDTLTAVMLVVVKTVSALVHLYSIGYMARGRQPPRFFAYLSLFTFAMLALVTADNFLQLFFGWEGVGLASYLLIGFWYTEARGQRRRDQGLRRQPGRRFRLRARHLRRLRRIRHHRFRRRCFARRPGMAGKPMRVPRATSATR